MEKGSLVELRLEDRRVLAVADRPDGKKLWVVIDETGKSHSLRPRDITYEVAGGGYAVADLGAFRAAAAPLMDPDSLEVAWELLVEDGESIDPPGLAEILFSDRGAPACYAAHVLLADDKLYFKQKGDRYEPRPVSQVDDLRQQRQREQQRERENQEFLDLMAAAIAGDQPGSTLMEGPFRQRIELLERLVIQGEEMTNRAAALDLLKSLDRPQTERGAFDLLVELGLWSPHENLSLRRAQTPTRFSAKVCDVALSCLTSPPPDRDTNRRDLTHLKVYTIDDESTREIDDGLSVEYLPEGGHRLWIHIADPTRWLVPGDDLDLEARRRATTVYLPTGSIPMFPDELATGPMSLVQGQLCCAMSFGVILAEDGSVESFEICPSTVKPTYRLTYEDVDEMLSLGIEAEAELEVLDRAARSRAQWRRSQGAIRIDMPEAAIKVKDDEIDIYVLDSSRSRQLVAEMMILTGEVAGRYGQAAGLPIPFRNQTQPELPPDEELMLLPVGPVRACAIRRCMPRSEVSVTPTGHASLGLETYTQVTSPIRRYADLLSHFQIKAHLRGEPLPFSVEAMQGLVQGVSATAYEASMVERQTNRYWILEYLRRQGSERIWQALMLRWLREDDGLASILIEDLGIEMTMRFNRSVDLGEVLHVRVSYVDPRQDTIQFREVAPERVAGEAAIVS